MTLIKLCGLKSAEAVEEVNRLRPAYAGFICTPGFRRSVSSETLKELKSLLDPEVKAVGVFVNEPVERVVSLLEKGWIDAVQLHGREDDAYLDALKARVNCTVLQAVKVDSPEALRQAENSHADLVVLDGGTGEGRPFDWSLLESMRRPYLLAGGLTPDNVRQAISALHPLGVDTSSGIETDGTKDPLKMRLFVQRVREMEHDK